MPTYDVEGPKRVNATLLNELVSEPWFKVGERFPKRDASGKYGRMLNRVIKDSIINTYHSEYKGKQSKWFNWTIFDCPLEQEQYDFLIALRDKWCIPKDKKIDEDY